MANKITNTQYYQDIANAIRQKNGGSSLYTPPQMAQAILNIPTGSDKPFRFGMGSARVYGVPSANIYDLNYSFAPYIITKNLRNYYDVSSVRIRGTIQSQSTNSARRCTSILELRKYTTGGGYTSIFTHTFYSGSSNGVSSTLYSMDETVDVSADDFDSLMFVMKAQTNYSNATYVLDRYTNTLIASTGVTVDGKTWNGLVVDYNLN